MFYNYYDNYQYDSCVSKGICSVGPKTSSLQEILIMYLKLLAFYTIELQQLNGHNNDAEKVILDTISVLMSNLETQNEQFSKTLLYIKTLLIDAKKTYLNLCKEKGLDAKFIKTNIKLDKTQSLTQLIHQGEQEYALRTKHLSPERKNLFEIIGFIVKSLCINIVELKSYKTDDELEKEGFNKILILLNFLNYTDTDTNDILDIINKSSETDYKIYKHLQALKEESYGISEESEVSYSTRPNKAILVAGTNLKELENVLDATKDTGIDIYTHGEMIFAHTYPKFKEYSNLIGQFGVGIENCLLDFATFPGPILITRYATENIEYLYRGRLFTTDYFVPKGVIKIENNNYDELIRSANESRGFKRGKQKEAVTAGCVKSCVKEQLNKFIYNIDKYKHLVIIGPETQNKRNRIYYENFLKNLSDDIFVISFSYRNKSDNVISLNGTTDFSIIYFIIEELKEKLLDKSIDISVFISKCDKHTISNLINLKNMGIKNIFLSKCAPVLLNPTLIKILSQYYDIKSVCHPVDDLKIISGADD